MQGFYSRRGIFLIVATKMIDLVLSKIAGQNQHWAPTLIPAITEKKCEKSASKQNVFYFRAN